MAAVPGGRPAGRWWAGLPSGGPARWRWRRRASPAGSRWRPLLRRGGGAAEGSGGAPEPRGVAGRRAPVRPAGGDAAAASGSVRVPIEGGGRAARAAAPPAPCGDRAEPGRLGRLRSRQGAFPGLCRERVLAGRLRRSERWFSCHLPCHPFPPPCVCSYGQPRRGCRRCAASLRPASGRAAAGPSSEPKGAACRRAVPALPRARGGAERVQTTLSGGSLGSCVDEERS